MVSRKLAARFLAPFLALFLGVPFALTVACSSGGDGASAVDAGRDVPSTPTPDAAGDSAGADAATSIDTPADDLRAQLVGTWSGALVPATPGGPVQTLTFELATGAGPTDLVGTFTITVPAPPPGALGQPRRARQDLLPAAADLNVHAKGFFDGALVAFGSISGALNGLGGLTNLDVKSTLNAQGVPVSELTNLGKLALTYAKDSPLAGTYMLGAEQGTLSATKQALPAAPVTTRLTGTTWAGNGDSAGGITVQLPGQEAMSPSPISVSFASQGGPRALSGTVTLTIGSNPPVTLPFSNGVQLVDDVIVAGVFPAGAPTLTVKGYALELAGKSYLYRGTIDGSGARQTGAFSIQLPAELVGPAALLGLTADSKGYFKAATVVISLVTPATGGPDAGADMSGACTYCAAKVFVLDHTNKRVVGLSDVGPQAVFSVAPATFNAPLDMASNGAGHLYVADYMSITSHPGGIVELDGQGAVVASFDPKSVGLSPTPSLLHVDAMGRIYWRDDDLKIHRIDNIKGDNRVDLTVSSSLVGAPFGMATDTNFYLYVLDGTHDQIVRFGPDLSAASAVVYGSKGNGRDNFDLVNPDFSLNANHGLAIGVDNHLYVADFNNTRIVRLDADGFNHLPETAGFNFTAVPLTSSMTGGATYFKPIAIAVDGDASHLLFTGIEVKDRTMPDYPPPGGSNIVNAFVKRMDTSGVTEHLATNLVSFGGPLGAGTGAFGSFPAAVAGK
jgi:hypothetical protein